MSRKLVSLSAEGHDLSNVSDLEPIRIASDESSQGLKSELVEHVASLFSFAGWLLGEQGIAHVRVEGAG
jgi:hypothetical protein